MRLYTQDRDETYTYTCEIKTGRMTGNKSAPNGYEQHRSIEMPWNKIKHESAEQKGIL